MAGAELPRFRCSRCGSLPAAGLLAKCAGCECGPVSIHVEAMRACPDDPRVQAKGCRALRSHGGGGLHGAAALAGALHWAARSMSPRHLPSVDIVRSEGCAALAALVRRSAAHAEVAAAAGAIPAAAALLLLSPDRDCEQLCELMYALCFDDGPRGLARRQHAASVGALDALVFIAKRGGPSECLAGARYALRAISSGCPKRWDAARKAGAPAAWLGEHCPHAEAMATADVYGAWQ